ncbi:MAG: tetratricopeptide repeat protein [Spirochaetaceae bacterium]|nr:tetratricopeptide repeat protein [Spirochaetaceae bacterium]
MRKITQIIIIFLFSITLVFSENAKEKADEVFTVGKFAENLTETITKNGLDAGLALFADVPESFADDYSINYMHASLLVSAQKPVEAEKIALELLNKNPDNLDVLFLNVMICKMQGKLNQKRKYLEAILKIDPANSDANAEMGNEKMLAKAYADAKSYYLKSFKNNPKYTTGLFGFGQACYYLGDFDEAKAAFKSILSISPKEDIAYSYLAKVDAETGDYDTAIEYILKAIEYNPDYYNYWIDYGDYLRFSTKYEEAAKVFSKAIEIDPDYFLGYLYRGGMYEYTEKYDEALADYKKVVSLNPQYYYAYESIGILAWNKKDWKECRVAFQKAYEKNPKNISYQLMISACYLREKNLTKNKEFLNKMLKNYDRSTVEYVVLRLYLDGLGDVDALRKVRAVESRNLRGKLLYYMGLFYDLYGGMEQAEKLYLEVKDMKAPMFFEYRLCEWALAEYGLEDV